MIVKNYNIKKIIITTILLFFVCIICLGNTKKTNNDNMFAIVTYDEDNKIIDYNENTWPSNVDYDYLEKLSGCINAKGKKIGSLKYDEDIMEASVEVESATNCYLYFKKVPKSKIIISKNYGVNQIKYYITYKDRKVNDWKIATSNELTNGIEINKGDKSEYRIYGTPIEGYSITSCKEASPCSGTMSTSPKSISVSATPNQYTLSFDANGGNVSTGSKTVTYDSSIGTLPTPTRTGYQFAGWYTERSGGTQYSTTTTYKTVGNRTLYAHWTANTYYIYYSGNGYSGGSTSMTTCRYDSYCYLAYNGFYKTGYTFSYWTDANGYSKSQGSSVINLTSTNGGSVTMYANWTPNTYYLYFDANGGYVSQSSKAVTYGNYVGDLPTPTRDGYRFLGWYTSQYGGTQYSYYTTYYNTNSTTLYALWEVDTYSLTIQGGYGVNKIYYKYGTMTKFYHELNNSYTINVEKGTEVEYYGYVPVKTGYKLNACTKKTDSCSIIVNSDITITLSTQLMFTIDYEGGVDKLCYKLSTESGSYHCKETTIKIPAIPGETYYYYGTAYESYKMNGCSGSSSSKRCSYTIQDKARNYVVLSTSDVDPSYSYKICRSYGSSYAEACIKINGNEICNSGSIEVYDIPAGTNIYHCVRWNWGGNCSYDSTVMYSNWTLYANNGTSNETCDDNYGIGYYSYSDF